MSKSGSSGRKSGFKREFGLFAQHGDQCGGNRLPTLAIKTGAPFYTLLRWTSCIPAAGSSKRMSIRLNQKVAIVVSYRNRQFSNRS